MITSSDRPPGAETNVLQAARGVPISLRELGRQKVSTMQ